ncbi:MAG: ABC transporter ATP-binding protein [Clostridia bacterium]|nr:ABC transporter ATP-binding protein [Clostridia bacterium]
MIICHALDKYYKESIGLEGIKLTIPDGEVVGVLGVNGAGKSTLLRIIAGLIAPTNGSVTIDGQPPEKMLADIAYISEAGSWFPSLDGRGHMRFLEKFYPRFDGERFCRLMKFFDLPLDKKAYAMSKGQRAKLETVIGFSKGAKYLLMDEPFLGKDIFTRRDFLKLAASMLDGETLLIATHEISEISGFLDRAVILHRGKLRADTTLDALAEDGRTLIDLMAEVCGYDPARAGQALE